MPKYEVNSIYEATTYFLDLVKKNGWKVYTVQPKHFERHRYIVIYREEHVTTIPRIVRREVRIYLVYQRHLLEEFDKLYGTQGMGKAVGINMSILEWATNAVDLLIFVTKDGMIFAVSPQKYLELVNENGWTRETRTKELVANLPIKYCEIL